ncbi:MAG: aminoacyl-tRNA hydrolase [Planctomycetia bacterium]|nr:aminoacyl-tRNA hydrolase [Planctomycetia bacterium]
MLKVTDKLQIPLSELTFTFSRSGGPGGQNVNKVASKALLRWSVVQSPSLPPDVRDRFLARFASRLTNDQELLLTSQRYRDQGRNIADCLEKLREMLATVARPPKRRRPTRPSKNSRERRLTTKRQQGEKKSRRRFSGGDA